MQFCVQPLRCQNDAGMGGGRVADDFVSSTRGKKFERMMPKAKIEEVRFAESQNSRGSEGKCTTSRIVTSLESHHPADIHETQRTSTHAFSTTRQSTTASVT
jgi:hypothetical protein